MAIGVKINNLNGQTIVDDRFENLMLRQKIVNPSFTTRPTGNPRWRCVLDIQCSPDAVIAYTCFNTWYGIAIASRLSTPTIRRIELGASSFFSNQAPNITIYVFDKPEFALIQGKIGLRVRNRITNALAFDSRGKYMKILGYLSPTELNSNVNRPLAFSGIDKIPAVVHVQTYRYNWSGTFDTGSGSVAESGENVIMSMNVGNTARVAVDEWVYSTGGSGGTFGSLTQGSNLIMFVDVTGY